MRKKTIYLFASFSTLLLFTIMVSCSNNKTDEFSERVKIALREVGNQLLLSNQDSTSLVLPVVGLEDSRYRLLFEETLSFEPSKLVAVVQRNFEKAKLPPHYSVQVIQCSNNEVAYSYLKSADEESTIIPCTGRNLPNSCYSIEVRFTNKATAMSSKSLLLFSTLLGVFILLAFVIYKRKKRETIEKVNINYAKLGSFQFYAEQNKLIKEAVEISLSKKECELLEIFVANPNQIIKREELTKKVWEDNGVFVGRSLDTYISKLRKKLKADESIKLTNVHGVGYKLEVKED